MKSISLYVDNGSWLCKVHPFTKLAYIATAISVPLLVGKLSFFAIFIALSLAVLASGRLLKRVVPLIAFSFTILITIFLIHACSTRATATSCSASDRCTFTARVCCMRCTSAATF